MGAHYFVGWSVGAWNCDDAKRQDALVVLRATPDGLEVAGMPVRGNVRTVLVGHRREELIRRLVSVCSVGVNNGVRITLSVDTPLGWPVAFVDLLTSRRAADVPEAVDVNPVLFRTTERALLAIGHRPKSPVRDMMGSPSSKAIHFLKRVGFSPIAAGLWRVVSPRTGSVYEAIETLPSIAKRSASLSRAFQHILSDPRLEAAIEDDKRARTDLEAAVWSALIAVSFVSSRELLRAPDADVPIDEGWIWIPKDAEPRQK